MARSGVLALVPVLAGAVLLGVAEPMTLRSVSVGGRTAETLSAGSHHGWALAVLAFGLVVLGVVAVARGSRAAALGAVVVAAMALWIVLGVDRPALDDAGLVAGRLARARSGPAFPVELAGALAALVGAIGAVALGRRQRRH